MTATETALEMADWLKNMLDSTRTRNFEVARAFESKGLKLSEASVANMKSRGMSVDRAVEVAKVMGWPSPVATPNMDAGDIKRLVDDMVEDAAQTSVTISSLQPRAGITHLNTENEILRRVEVPAYWIQSRHLDPKNLALCPIVGDSMEPTYKSGDTVLVDTSIKEFNYDGVFVFTLNDQLLIKRIHVNPLNGFTVISDNSLYPAYQFVETKNLIVHGRVVGSYRFN